MVVLVEQDLGASIEFCRNQGNIRVVIYLGRKCLSRMRTPGLRKTGSSSFCTGC